MKDTGLEELLESSKGTPERFLLYNDTVELFYDDSIHAYYTVEDGEKILIPSATTVVGMIDKGAALVQWSANMVRDHVLEAAEEYRLIDPMYEGDVCKIPYPKLVEMLDAARFNHRVVSKTATDIGEAAHEILNKIAKTLSEEPLPLGRMYDVPTDFNSIIVRHLKPDTPEKVCNCVKAGTDWMRQHKFTPLASEFKIYSKTWGYAGTADVLAYITACGNSKCCPFIGRALVLCDYKSSKALYVDYRAQLAAYQAAIEEEHPTTNIALRYLIRLGKADGSFEVQPLPLEEFVADFEGYLGCLQMYNWIKSRELQTRYAKAQAKGQVKLDKMEAKEREKVEKMQAKELKKLDKMFQKTQTKSIKPRRRVKVPVVQAAAVASTVNGLIPI